MAAAKQAGVRTAGGDVRLVTSADPAVIGMIQAHAKMTKEAYAKRVAEHANHDE